MRVTKRLYGKFPLDVVRELFGYARHQGKLAKRGVLNAFKVSEPFEKRRPFLGPYARYGFENRGNRAAPKPPVIGYGEPVRLVPYAP